MLTARSPDPGDAEIMASTLLTWMAATGSEPFGLATPIPLPSTLIAAVEACGRVRAIVAPHYVLAADPLNPAITTGQWDLAARRWVLPPLPPLLAVLAPRENIGHRMVAGLVARGVREILWVGANSIERRTLRAVVFRMLALKLASLLPRLQAKAPSRGRTPLDVAAVLAIESRSWRRFLHDATGAAWRRRWRIARTLRRLERVGTGAMPPVAGRVALFIGSLGPGGAERQLVTTLQAVNGRLAEPPLVFCDNLHRGSDNDFFLPAIAPEWATVSELKEHTSAEATESLQVLASRAGLRRRDLQDWFGIWQRVAFYREVISQHRPEVVHAWMEPSSLFVVLAAIISGVPKAIVASRSVAPYHFPIFQEFFRPIMQVLAAHPRVTLVNNSAAGAASYASWLGIPVNRYLILRNGMTDTTFLPPPPEGSVALRQQLGIPAGCPVVGGVFRIGEEKRPLLWLEVARAVADRYPDCRFLVIGDGPMRQDMIDTARRLGLLDRLILPGKAADVRLPLSLMDVFLLTSRQEGLPNVLVEAQAQGVPVVTTKVGGAAETLSEGHTGWAVERAEANALAAPIICLLNDAELRRRTAATARTFALANFGGDRIRQETLSLYGQP